MRIRAFSLIIAVLMVLLIGGLGYVQIISYEKYRIMSEENRLKLVPLMAPRGSISDRAGRDLVKDILSFNAAVIYSRIKDEKELISVINSISGLSEEELQKRILAAGKNPYVPVRIIENVDIEKAVQMEELSEQLPGLLVEVSSVRKYLYGKTASQVLGYTGYINRNEFNKLKSYGYSVNDRIGREGLERFYDDYLRGQHGGKQVEVDYRGREIRVISLKEPRMGKDLEITIDVRLQQFCDKLLEGKKGAIIVMGSATGEIIAMASAPSYDPNMFILPSEGDEIEHLLVSENYPLINRAVTGVYPPGSVFKVVVAAAALEEGKISADQTFTCSGEFRLGKSVFNCWRTKGHGTIALEEAIKGSCNVYFFNAGLKAGNGTISKYAEKMGLGEKTGIDLPGEREGTVPTSEWKRKKFRENWYKGDTLNLSIGQGYLLCSPVQLARLVSIFANKGHLVTPFLARKIEGIEINNPNLVGLDISEKTIDIVRNGMRKVVNDKHGTGVKARLKEAVVAGKTGTAQTSRGKSHGWFMGFAPFENAKLSVVVFDEYGGKGGYFAAETAGKVFQRAYELGLL